MRVIHTHIGDSISCQTVKVSQYNALEEMHLDYLPLKVERSFTGHEVGSWHIKPKTNG